MNKLTQFLTEPFLIEEGVNDPGILKAVFLAGGPGSGKSYVASGLYGIPKKVNVSAHGLKLVNQDKELTRMLKKYGFGTDLDNMPEDLFRQLTDPTYDDYSGMRSRGKEITAARKKLYMNGRLGMIIDGTGHKFGKIREQKMELEEIGYDCFMVFVHTDLEIAQQRNMERPRKLSPEIVNDSWHEVQRNKEAFQGLFGNTNFLMVNNNDTLSEKAATKKFNMLVKKGVGSFIRRPVKNNLGKKWVEKQKIMKEDINIPVKVGDTILVGKFKNKKMKIKDIGKDKHGMPTINGRKATTFRIHKTVNIFDEASKIKKVIGIYGGRFQPFGPHHKKTYEWLKKRVDDAYITTTNIKQPPRHPMNFKEKVRHMVKMGIPKNKIIQEVTPYVAKNTLSKHNSETTAVVYIFGKKDAGRLKGGTKKSGGKTYYQDYKKNKGNLEGFEQHGYILTAPHVSVSVGGKEVSGTVMRELLGSPKFDDSERQKLFKQAFGYFDKGVYTMMVNKFKKLFENKKLSGDLIEEFLLDVNVDKIIKEGSTSKAFGADDGPPTFYRGFSDYKKYSKEWIDDMYAGKGWEVLQFILGKHAVNPDFDYTLKYNVVPAVAYGRKQSGEYGTRFGVKDPINTYKNHISGTVLRNLGYEIIKWMGITPDGKKYTGVEVETPVLPGVGDDNVGNTKKYKLDLKERINLDEEGNLLVEGGAYGHMNHPFDDKNITFSDLKNIIILGLGGKLNREDGVTEKLDGQNLMVSWVDGKLVTARNKGQLKNFGATSMDIKGVASKFAGRGDIRDAFVFAMKDLNKSISSLSDKQKDKIFGNGKNWMNLEVMYPKSANVIDYDKAQIVFHGTLEYDESGTAIGQPKDSARMLAGTIKQVNQDIQKHYKIGKPQFLTVPKVQDFGKKKKVYLNRLKKLQNQYKLKDNDTLAKYHQSYWEEFIFNASKQMKYKIPNHVLVNLTKRWAFFDKSYKIPTIRKDIDNKKFLDWVLSFDKNDHSKWVKQNMKPFEVLFFDVGAEILKNISGYLAASPEKAVQKIRKDVINAIKTVKSGGDIKKIETLKHQLDKLEKIGGLSSIVPSEGIVFKYKGNTYKFTGAFAPVNQILGLLNF